MRYELDRLGWYDFEALIQVLLKARLGLGIETWSTIARGDWGRDAFFSGSLRFPTNDLTTGDFVFQCKFVHGANAAGARPEGALLKAVRAEAVRIEERRGREPEHYALLTNAPLAPDLRTKIAKILRAVMPNAALHQLGGGDVCDWLDLTSHVARGFPQILGIRQLKELLSLWSQPELVTRSRVLVERAMDDLVTFTPTRTYTQAIDILQTKRLVILEGPPEMGKTTIGRMLALSAVLTGEMEALECRRPIDLTRAYEGDRNQIFVVDDCFGRGSYEPSLGSEWEREFGSIVHLLNENHWLVLTSRAHLLNFALSTLDIERKPLQHIMDSRVVVDAAALTQLEKAHMLYRHAKRAEFAAEDVRVVKANAAKIVDNRHYTPERIRILVENIPGRGNTPIADLIQSCLETPTASMRKSFRQLGFAYKWLLYSLLDHEGHAYEGHLKQTYERLCPLDVQLPFASVAGNLDQAFIRRSERQLGVVHPTVIDLLTEELAEDLQARRRFLELCSGHGVSIAIMVQGGAKGESLVPLLAGDVEWEILEKRAEAELLDAKVDALELLHLVAKAQSDAGKRARESIDRIAAHVLPRMSERWSVPSVKTFLRVAHKKHRPVVDHLWREQVERVENAAADNWVSWQNYSRLEELSDLFKAIVDLNRADVVDVPALWSGLCRAIEAWSKRPDFGFSAREWVRDHDMDSVNTGYERIREIMDYVHEQLKSAPDDLAESLREDIDSAGYQIEDITNWCMDVKDYYDSHEWPSPEGHWSGGAGSGDRSVVDKLLERRVDIKSLFEDL